jgi:protein AFG1
MRLPASSLLRASSTRCCCQRRPLSSPAELYDARVKSGELNQDDFQRTVVAKLDALHQQLKSYHPPDIPKTVEYSNWFDKLRGHPTQQEVPPIPDNGPFALFTATKMSDGAHAVPKGMYLHGDVGCGKTMLMDLFCAFSASCRTALNAHLDESIPENLAKSKRRVHFHAFMEDVHKRGHRLSIAHKAGQDLIVPISRQLARDARILCFDEFQVLDIVDAMILKRLMESLIAYGVVCVLTSKFVVVNKAAKYVDKYAADRRTTCTKTGSSANPSSHV